MSKASKGRKKGGAKSIAPAPPSDASPRTREPAPASEPVVTGGMAKWSVPSPAAIPPPTFWPAGLAFGLTLTLWGFVTSIVILSLGLLAAVVSLVGWIGDMRHEAESS